MPVTGKAREKAGQIDDSFKLKKNYILEFLVNFSSKEVNNETLKY